MNYFFNTNSVENIYVDYYRKKSFPTIFKKQKYPLWVLILRFQKLFIYFFVPKRTFQWNVLTFFLSMKNLEKLFPL